MINPQTGKTALQKRLTTEASSSPIAVADRIYITSEAGRTTVISSKDQTLLAENELGEEVYATMAIAGGDIFIRGTTHLFRVHDQADESRP